MKKVTNIFATDMDGTFLRDDHYYEEKRLAFLLDKMDIQDELFCAASGRAGIALEKLFEPVKNRISYVAENGGLVIYKGKEIFTASFSMDQVKQIVQTLHELPAGTEDFLISGKNGAYIPETASEEYFKHLEIYYANGQRYRRLEDIDDEMLKVTTNFPERDLKFYEKELNARVPFIHATPSGFTSIDIIPAGISKATGLEALAKYLGLAAEDVIAFGDQLNDLEMMRYAGTSIAVENAVPEIKAVADYVIGNNNDSSVLVEMEKLI